MKKLLVGTFYILQGICHLILFVFPIRVGATNGGGMAGLEIMLRGFFALVCGFSLLTGLLLFLEKKDLALRLGFTASVLFILFWGISIIDSYYSIVLGHYVYHYSILLMISLIIVVLNVVSVFGLFSIAKEKRIYACIPKDTHASLIPKGRFCKQCGKLVSVELSSCPNCGKELKTS